MPRDFTWNGVPEAVIIDTCYSSVDSSASGYYCLGNNNTCPNKTSSEYDLYCGSCDPEGDGNEN